MKISIRQVITTGSILISGLLTFIFSTYTNPILILTLPGLLFGLALTLPNIHPNYSSHKTELIIGLAYPAIWALSLGLIFTFQMISPTLPGNTPYIIIGIYSGLAVSIAFDWQFGLMNKTLGLITATALSMTALLLGDYLFPNPADKELNIGKQIAIWEILVGVGLILNKKTKKHEVIE